MNPLLLFLFFHLLFCERVQSYDCFNYKLLHEADKTSNEKSAEKFSLKCNLIVSNPKKIINPYKIQLQNYVESKPFASVCLKCGMCLAIAKEMDRIFKETCDKYQKSKQAEVVNLLFGKISSLCSHGFENYDLRKFKQYQIVSDKFKCSSHVRSKMDGKWPEKLREICSIYSQYMDVQYLLNDYLTKTNDISNYLCWNNGIFRDCSSLNVKNTSIIPDGENNFVDVCD